MVIVWHKYIDFFGNFGIAKLESKGMETGRKIEIMGIVNLTDDSFFEGSRNLRTDGSLDEDGFIGRLEEMVGEGADILDFGACSTRPGSDSISEEEEWRRLEKPLQLFVSRFPEMRLSIDTFRPEIARKAFDIVGPFIVNDVSGGCEEMWRAVSELSVPYVAMHTRGTPKDMQTLTDYDDVTESVIEFFEGIAQTADKHGVSDWILDPGFGFAKTVEQNWKLLREMSAFSKFDKKILAGLSRKSFMYRPLGITPAQMLSPTQVANYMALNNGADILRVHDVGPARQTVSLYNLYNGV